MKFCLAYEIRVLMVLPHRYQANKSKYPKTKISYLYSQLDTSDLDIQ
jgi:hypothetical protein